MTTVDCIVRGNTIITMDAARNIIHKGALAICKGSLIAIDNFEAIAAAYTAPYTIDVGDDILLPGFINAHSHAPMALFRGCADDVTLREWLANAMFPLEKIFLNEEFTYYGSLLAILEMLRGGITTVVDMYWHTDGNARAYHDMGMRAIIGATILHDHELEQAKTFIQHWNDSTQLTCAIAPHSVARVPLLLLHKTYDLACQRNIPFLIHVDETQEDAAIVQTTYGCSATALLAQEHILSRRSILAHMVHASSRDCATAAAAGAGIVHCPTSNMKLASGIAPVVAMQKVGCSVGLGTDGAASNNSLDMVAEMKAMVLLQRIREGRADSFTAWSALEAATIGGARAIHKDHEIGSLEVGKKADIISVSLGDWHTTPSYDPVSTLIYAGSRFDVRTVMINGIIKVQNGVLQFPREQLAEIRNYVQHLTAQIQSHLV